MTTDKEHLQWMLNRLVEVHEENRNIDYMVRMQKIIDNTKTELNLHLVSLSLSAGDEIVVDGSKRVVDHICGDTVWFYGEDSIMTWRPKSYFK